MYIFVTQELNVKLAELQEKTESAEKERQQQLQQMNEVIQSLWLFYYVFLNFINHNVPFHFSYRRARGHGCFEVLCFSHFIFTTGKSC